MVLDVPSVADLLDPGALARLLGLSRAPSVEPLDTLGYSGSTFHRVRPSGSGTGGDGAGSAWIVKRTVLADDWFSRRTGDRVGREAAAVSAPELAAVHDVFRLPYRAVAMEPGRIALLMDDLSAHLLPDERAPLDPDDEELLLDTLARLHAAFWDDPALDELSWLHAPADFLHVMGPLGHDEAGGGGSARGVDEAVRSGWSAALARLPRRVRDALTRPAREIARAWRGLPRTLVHGDTKVANFAVLPGRQLAVFDWAFVGRAPCTFELGWYLAVNATRLTRTKEATLARYRELLQARLGRALPDGLWTDLEEAGVVCGALMLLWSKASAVEADRPGAREEWAWWVERLEAWTG